MIQTYLHNFVSHLGNACEHNRKAGEHQKILMPYHFRLFLNQDVSLWQKTVWVGERWIQVVLWCSSALRKLNPRNVSRPDTDTQAGGGRNTSNEMHCCREKKMKCIVAVKRLYSLFRCIPAYQEPILVTSQSVHYSHFQIDTVSVILTSGSIVILVAPFLPPCHTE